MVQLSQSVAIALGVGAAIGVLVALSFDRAGEHLTSTSLEPTNGRLEKLLNKQLHLQTGLNVLLPPQAAEDLERSAFQNMQLEANDEGYSIEDTFVEMRHHLLKQTNPRVLVMGAAISKARPTVDGQIENPENRLWQGIPGISVEGTDYAGGEMNEGGDISFRFVKYKVDAHFMTKVAPADTFDVVLSVAVMEHVRYPWLVSREMVKCLKPGGMLIVMTHHTMKLHGYPFDFYRFSREALESLFEQGIDIKKSWYQNQARYFGDPGRQGLSDGPAWVNSLLYGYRKEGTTSKDLTWVDEYPYRFV